MLPLTNRSAAPAGSYPKMVDVTRRATRTLLAVLLVPFVWLIAGTPAFAHDRLVRTTPSSGARVTSPTTVQLQFSDTVVPTGSRIEVKAPGDRIVSTDLAVEGSKVSVQLTQPVAAGKYSVVWRVTSADGHPISGDFTFGALAAPTAPTSTPSSSPSAAPPSSAPPAATSTKAGSTPVPPQRAPTNDTNNQPGWIFGAVGIGAFVIAAGVVVSRRRLTDDEPADGPDEEDA